MSCRRQQPTYARHLVVMVKEPVAGRVKTRLARDIGTARAVGFARAQARAVIARLASDPRWITHLGVGPETALRSRVWPHHIARLSQGPGDLGRRMQRFFDVLPRGPVIIVGADIPAVRAPLVAEAFRLLGSHQAVFGPASDGGYWLVGLKRLPRILQPFDGVRWSSRHALDDTLSNLDGCSIARITTLSDIDDGSDLVRAAHVAGRLILSSA